MDQLVAMGVNATTLHYVYNDQTCRDGELLLIDAGGEYNFFTADITRVYPVNGKFTDTQKRIYQKMLTMQKDLVNEVKPGQTREDLQKMAINVLTEVLLDEKLIKGKKDELIEKKRVFQILPSRYWSLALVWMFMMRGQLKLAVSPADWSLEWYLP